MNRRPRSGGTSRGWRNGGRRGTGAPSPPVIEAPEIVPGLKAWFDSRDPTYFGLGGAGEVSAWLSRAGTLGGIPWTQGTASNQPIRVAAEPLFNGLAAVLFDGVNDDIDTSNQNAWTFLHNGSGASIFRVIRFDGASATTQVVAGSETVATHVGITDYYSPANANIRYANGSGTRETWTIANVAHCARDVTRWHMIGFDTPSSYSRVSGSSLSDPNVLAPSASPPSTALRIGQGGVNSFKGWIAQDIYYDHVLTAGETTQLGNWAAATYGVAA